MDDTNSQPDAFSDMVAAFNDHQITDDQGQIAETPAFEETTAQETNTVDDTATAEKPAETEDVAPATNDETESTLAEDETGKRYVPESRFKEVYAKAKELERELEKSKQAQPIAGLQNTPDVTTKLPPIATDRTEALEVELLKTTLPQFNPDSPEYDRTLDEMGSEIFRANPGITRIEAAKRALKRASELTKTTAAIKAEARQVKSLQSDQGITSRVEKRVDNTPDINKMNDKELEAYLRSTGQW